MKREDVERMLKEVGWIRTAGSPLDVVDYTRWKPYNRIILFREDWERLNEEKLRRLMETSPDSPERIKIWKEIRESPK